MGPFGMKELEFNFPVLHSRNSQTTFVAAGIKLISKGETNRSQVSPCQKTELQVWKEGRLEWTQQCWIRIVIIGMNSLFLIYRYIGRNGYKYTTLKHIFLTPSLIRLERNSIPQTMSTQHIHVGFKYHSPLEKSGTLEKQLIPDWVIEGQSIWDILLCQK